MKQRQVKNFIATFRNFGITAGSNPCYVILRRVMYSRLVSQVDLYLSSVLEMPGGELLFIENAVPRRVMYSRLVSRVDFIFL